MNYEDAIARRHSLRDGQTARARLVPHEAVDMEALAAEARASGVPPRFAGVTKGSLPAGEEYDKVASMIDDMASPDTGNDGVLMVGSDVRHLGFLAGAVYSGAMGRHRAAKWYTFSEFVDKLTQKISFDKQNEWDVGEMRDWHTELDSAKYCYDLVVVHNLMADLMTPFVGGELHKLVSARSIRGLYTVLTARSGQADMLWDHSPAMQALLEEEFAFYGVTA